MLASFEYDLSKDEYASGLRVAVLALGAQDRRRWWWSVAYLALIVSAVAIAATLKPGSFDGVITALVILLIGFCAIQARWARNWRELSFEPDTASRTVTLDADGIAERRGLVEAHWPWAGVRRIYDRSDAVILQMAGWHLITLPNRLWAGPDERTEFIELVRSRSTNLLPDLKSSALSTDGSARLLSCGALAAGLDAFVLMNLFEGRLVCPCTMYRLLGHNYTLYAAVWMAIPFIAAAAAWKLAQVSLNLLDRAHPKAASALAKLFLIGLFVALVAGPFMKR